MRRFFNRLDLSVSLICILLLFLVVGSVGKKGRENAKRMVCSNNISRLLEGMTVYAGEHDGRFPFIDSGVWPCDLDYDTLNTLLDSMGIDVQQPLPVQDVFYCPSNIPQKKARDIYWTFGDYDYMPFRVIGYFFLWAQPWNSYGALPVKGSGNKKYIKTIYVDNPAEAELVIDIVMSDRRPSYWPPDEYPNGNFARILCGGMPFYGIFDSSSHLINEKEPAGGNIGFVDGHVAWRPFSLMEQRWGTDCPASWW